MQWKHKNFPPSKWFFLEPEVGKNEGYNISIINANVNDC